MIDDVLKRGRLFTSASSWSHVVLGVALLTGACRPPTILTPCNGDGDCPEGYACDPSRAVCVSQMADGGLADSARPDSAATSDRQRHDTASPGDAELEDADPSDAELEDASSEDAEGQLPDAGVAGAWPHYYQGVGEFDRALALAVDPQGDVYVAGAFATVVDFGGATLETAGDDDAFLVSYTPAGDLRWAKNYGSVASGEDGNALAPRPTAGVVLGGRFQNTITLGSEANRLNGAGSTGYVGVLGSDGGHFWSRTLAPGFVTDIDVWGAGNIAIGGALRGAVDLGGGMLDAAGGEDIYIAEFDGLSAHLFSASYGNAFGQRVDAVAQALDGTLYVAGTFSDTISIGGEAHTTQSRATFLLAFDSNRSLIRDTFFASPTGSETSGLATDSASNVYLACSGGYMDFGAGLASGGGTSAAHLASFDPAGNLRWANHFVEGANGVEGARAVAVGPGDSIWVAGTFNNSIDLGGGALPHSGGFDLFVGLFDVFGFHLWSTSLGGEGDEYVYDIAVGADGAAYLAGHFTGVTDLGEGPVSSLGGWDGFVVRLEP